MRIHWEESATTKTAPFRLNPSGAGGPPTYQTEAAGVPQALYGIGKAGHDEKTAPVTSVSNLGGHSLLHAANPKTPARGPRDCCHGLLANVKHFTESSVELTGRTVPGNALQRLAAYFLPEIRIGIQLD